MITGLKLLWTIQHKFSTWAGQRWFRQRWSIRNSDEMPHVSVQQSHGPYELLQFDTIILKAQWSASPNGCSSRPTSRLLNKVASWSSVSRGGLNAWRTCHDRFVKLSSGRTRYKCKFKFCHAGSELTNALKKLRSSLQAASIVSRSVCSSIL